MNYRIIQPPFTLKFRDMSRAELRDYRQWFMEVMPERIAELTAAVQQTPGFEAWQPTKEPASLDALGEWLAGQVAMRPRTGEELHEIESQLRFPIDIPAQELTNRTFSLAIDTGMYLSQVFLHNHPTLRWDQPFGNKKFVDYGQPVLIEFSSAPFNPTRMMVTCAYGLVDNTWTGRQLRELYDIWVALIRPTT